MVSGDFRVFVGFRYRVHGLGRLPYKSTTTPATTATTTTTTDLVGVQPSKGSHYECLAGFVVAQPPQPPSPTPLPSPPPPRPPPPPTLSPPTPLRFQRIVGEPYPPRSDTPCNVRRGFWVWGLRRRKVLGPPLYTYSPWALVFPPVFSGLRLLFMLFLYLLRGVKLPETL